MTRSTRVVKTALLVTLLLGLLVAVGFITVAALHEGTKLALSKLSSPGGEQRVMIADPGQPQAFIMLCADAPVQAAIIKQQGYTLTEPAFLWVQPTSPQNGEPLLCIITAWPPTSNMVAATA